MHRTPVVRPEASSRSRRRPLLNVRVWSVALTVVLVLSAFVGVAAAHEVEEFSLRFGEFQARGELTYPADASGPFPTVILVHGSGPADMDNTIADQDGMGGVAIRSAIFRDIAEHLSGEGFAVVRYNKRFVNGPNEFDPVRYFTEVDLSVLAEDLETVVRFAKDHPLVDENALFLYGWSEGSTVAAHVAGADADVAGLIVQGPVAAGWRDTFTYQTENVGIGYLRDVADGEPVTDETLLRIFADPDAGIVAKSILTFLVDGVALQSGRIEVNSLLDQDGNGQLDIETEIVPGIPMLLDMAFGPFGALAMYGPERALPPVGEQKDSLGIPILILQGGEDANTPVEATRPLADLFTDAGLDVTLHVYEGLGHSLGPAESRRTDRFAPIAVEPLEDVVTWLRVQSQGL